MLSWKPLQDASAFRAYCKGIGKDIKEYDDIAKNIEIYEDDPKWRKLIADSKIFVGVIESVSESPCFAEGVKVRTTSGYRNIEDISVGDYVFTHKGRYRRVTRLYQKYGRNLLKVKCMGSVPFLATANHPFLVRSRDGNNYVKIGKRCYKTIRKFSNPYWKECSELKKGDYIAHPVNSESIIPCGDLPFDDERFWWIVGRYIGDGWCRIQKNKHHLGSSYHVFICCNKKDNECKEIEENLDGIFYYTKTEEKTTFRYDISSFAFHSYLTQFGKYANGKKITDDILNLPIELLKSFIDGYISADGYKPQNRNSVYITTVSKDLSLGIQECIHKCYKKPTTLVFVKKEKIRPSLLEDGRAIEAKNDIYTISFASGSRYQNGFYEDGYMWLPFRSIEETGLDELVYNFSVEEDESYTVENIAVHNCSMLLYDKPVRKELGMIRTSKGEICCMLDGLNCDHYKYLKND